MVCLTALLHQGACVYDCRLFVDGCNGKPCELSGPTPAPGTCDCAADSGTSEYYNCIGTNTAAEAADVCVPTDLCASDDNNAYGCSDANTCMCNAKYVTDTTAVPGSDQCGVPRFGATCDTDKATLRFYPFQEASFGGTFKLMDGTTVLECPLVQGSTMGTDDHIWTLADYPYTDAGALTSPCVLPEASTTGPQTYTFTVYQQQNMNFKSTTDVTHTIVCEASGMVTTTAVSVPMTNAPSTGTGSLTVSIAAGVTFTLANGDLSTPLATPVAANAQVAAQFAANVDGAFDNIILVTLTAKNHPFESPEPEGALTLKLVTEACVDKDALGLVTEVTKPAAASGVGTISVIFGVFRFQRQAEGHTTGVPEGTNWLQGVIAIASYDREGVADRTCAQVTEDAGGPHPQRPEYADLTGAFAGRRKRDTFGNDNEQRSVYLNVTMVVEDPFGSVRYQDEYDYAADRNGSCYNSVAFIVPLALMAFLMLAAIGLAFFFCLRLTGHHGNHMEGTASMAYKS